MPKVMLPPLAAIPGAIASAIGFVVGNIVTTWTIFSEFVRRNAMETQHFLSNNWNIGQFVVDEIHGRYQWVIMAFQGFPIYIKFPVLFLGTILSWIVALFRSLGSLWSSIYLTILVWVFLGMLMVPFLHLEEHPDDVVEVLDALTTFFLILWGFFVFVWNICADLGRPFIPLHNILLANIFEFWVVVLEVLEEVMGAKSTTRSSSINFEWWNNLVTPIILIGCRIWWTIFQIFLLLLRLVLTFLAKIMFKIMGIFMGLGQYMSCCGANIKCCMNEMLETVINKAIIDTINSVILKPISRIGFGGAYPFSDFCCIEHLSIGCANDELLTNGVICKCAEVMYSNLEPCPACHFECVETSENMNFYKLCPGDRDNPETIVEAGWCSLPPPEGKGPKPQRRLLQSLGVTIFAVASRLGDIAQQDCFQTKSNGLFYERCLSNNYQLTPPTRSLSENIAPQSWSEAWIGIESDILHSKDDPFHCKRLFQHYTDHTILNTTMEHVFKHEMCITYYGMDTSPLKQYLHHPHVTSETSLDFDPHFRPQPKDFYDAQLSHHFSSLFDLSSKMSFHFQRAHTHHTRSFNPLIHRSRAVHFASKLDLPQINAIWKSFEIQNDQLMQHTGMSRQLDQIKHWAKQKRRMVETTKQTSLFNPEFIVCAPHEFKCSDGKTCVAPPSEDSKAANGLEADFQICPALENPTLFQEVWEGFLLILKALIRFDFVTLLNVLFKCWKDRSHEEDPYSIHNMGVNKDDSWIYCFPQINPDTDLSLSDTDWRLQKWINQVCTDIQQDRSNAKYKDSFGVTLPYDEQQGCLCTEYYTSAVNEYNAKWFWFVPIYIKARLANAILVAQFLISHYFTQDTFIDHYWSSFWSFLFPSSLPDSFIHFFGQRTDLPEGIEWLCVVLHLGSIFYIMFWFYFSFLFYRSFMSFFQRILSDLAAFWLFIWNGFFNATEYSLNNQPEEFPDVEQIHTHIIPIGSKRNQKFKRRSL